MQSIVFAQGGLFIPHPPALRLLRQLSLVDADIPDVQKLAGAITAPISFYESLADLSQYLKASGCELSVADLVSQIASPDVDLKPGMQSVVPTAIAHHRLAWIHPFADGNGRVARLMTDAMLRRYGINEHGLWSLSRGFAKNADNYKAYLASADEPRRGDPDGRGNLSTSALREFVLYLLSTAVDQVEYMTSLFELPTLSARIDAYITQARRELRPESAKLLKQALAAGELDRGELASITGLHERIARDIARQLLAEGMLVSDSPRGMLRISFPAKVLGWYFPNLYPAGADDQIEKPEVKGKARRPRRRPS